MKLNDKCVTFTVIVLESVLRALLLVCEGKGVSVCIFTGGLLIDNVISLQQALYLNDFTT